MTQRSKRRNRLGRGTCAGFALCVGLLICTLASTNSLAEYYPERPTYDWDKVPTDCEDRTQPESMRGRCGPRDGPVFNSFVNTPSYGDERSFVDARCIDAGKGSNENVLTVLSQEGCKRVIVRLYVVNDANEREEERMSSTAHDVTVRVNLPSDASSALRARGAIESADATPPLVEDTVDFVAEEGFQLRYVPGTARAMNHDSTWSLADTIVTDGAPLGSNANKSTFLAGADHSVFVEIEADVVPTSRAAQRILLIGFGGASLASIAIPALRKRTWIKLRDWSGRNEIGPKLVVALIVMGIVALVGASIAGLFSWLGEAL